MESGIQKCGSAMKRPGSETSSMFKISSACQF